MNSWFTGYPKRELYCFRACFVAFQSLGEHANRLAAGVDPICFLNTQKPQRKVLPRKKHGIL
jgi:hypothetical protein